MISSVATEESTDGRFKLIEIRDDKDHELLIRSRQRKPHTQTRRYQHLNDCGQTRNIKGQIQPKEQLIKSIA